MEQAGKYAGGLIDAMEALAKDPSRGLSAEDIRPGYWRRATGAHVIFYKRTGYGIDIVRIRHQRMDFGAQLE